jgi:hypothetical protein
MHSQTTDGLPNQAIPGPNALPFSPDNIVARYRRHVDHFDLSETQKAELLLTVWQIMGSFVDRAFGDDAVQLARKDGDGSQGMDEAESPLVIECQDNPAIENKDGLSGAFGQQAAGKRGRRRQQL